MFKLFAPVSILTGDGRFADFQCALGCFRARGFQNGGGLITNFRDAGQIALVGLQQIFQTRQTMVHQHVGLLAGNSGNRRQRVHSFGDFFFKAFGHDVLGFNVHLPAGELGGQPRVLSALANRQGELIFAGNNVYALAGFVDFKILQLRRRKRVGDEIRGRSGSSG